jgi:hypothetical protein
LKQFIITFSFLTVFLPTLLLGQTTISTDTTIIVDHYKTRKFDCAIFPYNYKKNYTEHSFTPTRQDVDKAEEALRKQLKKLNIRQIRERAPLIHKNLKKYKRQYFGYIDKEGHKILLINCFWADSDKDYWLTERVKVFDGGSYYWRVKFDLTTGLLFELKINGYA